MSEQTRRTLHAVLAIASTVLLVTTLSALAVVRANNREPETRVAQGPVSGTTGGGTATGGTASTGAGGAGGPTSGSGSTDQPAGGGGAATSAGTSGGGSSQTSSADQQAAAGGGSGGSGGGSTQTAGGGRCPDYNPDEGVYCDRILIGGTTVLSGPLAIYGEQGLKGGQSWIQYFNQEIAPKEGLRKVKLVYYDDGLDPNRTLQFTQRLVEVDKVLLIGGVTSPAAIADYIEQKGVPFIGDIGLNNRSYKSPVIFPTAPDNTIGAMIRTKMAVQDANIQSMAVIQDVLPGDTVEPFRQAWIKAAEEFGVEFDPGEDFYTIDSEANDCGGKMLNALRGQPEWIMLPIAAAPMLACVNEASTQQAGPGKPGSPWLKNWGGGSNLQFEVDQCGEACYGMYSGGTPFLDPRENDSPEARKYLEYMARYAPGIDVTGFITINYYQAGLLQYQVMKQGGILNDLSRQNVLEAAQGFGPFETGFGNTVQWKEGQIPRVPSRCLYRVKMVPPKDGEDAHWEFGDQKVCV